MRLYHTTWSGERAHLHGCSWSDDPVVIQNYYSLCQERTEDFSDHPDESFNLGPMFERETDVCVSMATSQVAEHAEAARKRAMRSLGGRHGGEERSEVASHQRVKRGFIVPGTLWCGAGNKAPSYDDLGVFSDTDSCCRDHDQCDNNILSFQTKFGVFNSNMFTLSHCDCDDKFRNCLMATNDSLSDVVGYTFFNLLKMHCFVFAHRPQCTQRNWFGMCKETQMTMYAIVNRPMLYELSPRTDNSTNYLINATEPAGGLPSNMSDLHPFSIAAAASTVPMPSTSSASITPVTVVTASTGNRTSEGSAAPERGDDLENTLPTKNQTLPEQDVTDNQLSCGIYTDLDECSSKIPPQQQRFGLHNSESKTLYHCNCTTRFFQTLAKQRQLTEVQTLLLGYVSQSCFLTQNCTEGNSCSAVVVKLELPQLNTEEQRHLQAVRLNVRRPSTGRAKRRDRAIRLQRLCLRMVEKTPNAVRGRKLV